MLRRISLWPLLLIALFTACTSSGSVPTAATRHVLVISLDGLKPEYYLSARELGISIPNLQRLMSEGTWAEGVAGVFPTMTYPSHGTLMTGVRPAQHGIISNRYFDPLGKAADAWYWYADDFRVPTLISAVAASGRSTAAIAWPSSINIGATFNVPDFWRPGANHASDRHLLEGVSSPPDILDAAGDYVGRRIGERNDWSDREPVDIARYVIERHRPTLTMVHLTGTDAAQHDHGPGSPEAWRAVEKADGYVGELLDSLQRAGIADSTVVFVVSDHGFLPATRRLFPNTLLREHGFITVGGAGRVETWRAMFHADGGSAILHLYDPADTSAVQEIRALLEARMKTPGSGIRRILDASEIQAMGGEAVLAIEVEDGFRAHDRATGAWIEPFNAMGTHGHPPDREEMLASLIIANVPARGSLGRISMTQVAPTIAQLLGVSLSPSAGEPLPVMSRNPRLPGVDELPHAPEQ